ncbi:hypothetical protein [Prolixibacter sp. NT017]|nr:hypothetical protein [Prolixibacter sp. NT017]
MTTQDTVLSCGFLVVDELQAVIIDFVLVSYTVRMGLPGYVQYHL